MVNFVYFDVIFVYPIPKKYTTQICSEQQFLILMFILFIW